MNSRDFFRFSYIFWVGIVWESLGGDQEDIGCWFAFFHIRITRAHDFVMEQFEQFLMMCRFDVN